MKYVTLEVFVSDESALKSYDVAALDAAVKDGEEHGSLKVTVARTEQKSRGEVRQGYLLAGNCLVVVAEDWKDVGKVDERLAADLGEIGSEDKVLGMVKGDSVNLLYVLNHDGLPLSYNAAIRDTFAKEGQGRVNMAEWGAAVAWAAVANPDLCKGAGTTEGRKAIIEAYKASR